MSFFETYKVNLEFISVMLGMLCTEALPKGDLSHSLQRTWSPHFTVQGLG